MVRLSTILAVLFSVFHIITPLTLAQAQESDPYYTLLFILSAKDITF
ncbi:MAG: hypothetical protein Q8O95_01510 [bacterium]|nr:hypothetical protein [bacterium]